MTRWGILPHSGDRGDLAHYSVSALLFLPDVAASAIMLMMNGGHNDCPLHHRAPKCIAHWAVSALLAGGRFRHDPERTMAPSTLPSRVASLSNGLWRAPLALKPWSGPALDQLIYSASRGKD
eukprot:363979-Chlamydomonas_euryale.AAC.6